jgi:hypothetical protein
MPVGRIYQAPALTVPRQTPVYGFNGIKSATATAAAVVSAPSSSLAIAGRSGGGRKSKSPSPQLSNSHVKSGGSNSALNNNNYNKGGSQGPGGLSPPANKGAQRSRSRGNSRVRTGAKEAGGGRGTRSLLANGGRDSKSWSPEEEDDNVSNNNNNNSDSLSFSNGLSNGSQLANEEADNSRLCNGLPEDHLPANTALDGVDCDNNNGDGLPHNGETAAEQV